MVLKKSLPFIMIAIGIFASTLRAQDAKKAPAKAIETIVGTWKIQKILSGNKEVAKNPTSGQWLEFMSDGKYVHQATTLDSGSYRLDENQSILFMESSVHVSPDKNSPKEISEWSVTFHEDTMTLQRKPTKHHADKMKYIYIRIADGSTAVNR